MLVITETTDTIKAYLGGASVSPLPMVAAYRDITTSAYTPARNAVNSNGVTAVTVVASPSASTQRVIDFINIYNPNSANATVNVTLDLNGTAYI